MSTEPILLPIRAHPRDPRLLTFRRPSPNRISRQNVDFSSVSTCNAQLRPPTPPAPETHSVYKKTHSTQVGGTFPNPRTPFAALPSFILHKSPVFSTFLHFFTYSVHPSGNEGPRAVPSAFSSPQVAT